MVNNKKGPDNYKTLKNKYWANIKNPEMLKFIPDHLDTKKMCKNAVAVR